MSRDSIKSLISKVGMLEESCMMAADACDSPASLLRRMGNEFTFIKLDLERISSETANPIPDLGGDNFSQDRESPGNRGAE
jgi:hypothetical protein